MSESTYRTLVAWQRSMDLVVHVYQFTASFPDAERYGLSQQMRRAALSVPSNIAEGRGRATDRDYKHFCVQARGSLYELDSEMEAAKRLGFADEAAAAELQKHIEGAIKPLAGLIRKLTE
jgi:four helix bundle protein